MRRLAHVIVWNMSSAKRHTNADVDFNGPFDVDLGKAMETEDSVCEVEIMESEDPLFILYTSGSTGKPKGLQHSSAGYLCTRCLLINTFLITRKMTSMLVLLI